MKPRVSWHGGEDPNAIREVKDEFDFEWKSNLSLKIENEIKNIFN